MDVKRNGSQPSGKGPAEWFTGNVRIDPLFQPNDSTATWTPSRARLATSPRGSSYCINDKGDIP